MQELPGDEIHTTMAREAEVTTVCSLPPVEPITKDAVSTQTGTLPYLTFQFICH